MTGPIVGLFGPYRCLVCYRAFADREERDRHSERCQALADRAKALTGCWVRARYGDVDIVGRVRGVDGPDPIIEGVEISGGDMVVDTCIHISIREVDEIVALESEDMAAEVWHDIAADHAERLWDGFMKVIG